MRKAGAMLVGLIAALAVIATPLATPALAKATNTSANATAEAPKANDASASPACQSYEQTPEGQWKPIPCQEVGAEAHAPKKRTGGRADAASH